MAKDPTYFNKQIDKIRNDNESWIDLADMELSGEDIALLTDALSKNRSATHLVVSENPLDDASATLLAEAVAQHPSLESVTLRKTGIGDVAARAFAEALKGNQTVNELNLINNAIGDAGVEALAEMLGQNRRITRLHLHSNPLSEEAVAVLDEAVMHSKNICIMPVDTVNTVEKHCGDNVRAARALVETLKTFTPSNPGEPAFWLECLERKGAIFHDSGNIKSKMEALQTFLDTLPALDLSQPLSPDQLTAKQGDYSALDNPATWLEFPAVLANLNANGHYLNSTALLEADGKTPGPILQRAVEMGKTDALFTSENWMGADRSDFLAVVHAMPAEKQTIPNRQQLQIAIDRNTRAEQHGLA